MANDRKRYAKGRTHRPCRQRLDALGNEDMIEPQERKTRREGWRHPCTSPSVTPLNISHANGRKTALEKTIGDRGRDGVEISGEDDGLVPAGIVSNPRISQKHLRLQPPFPAPQAEMRIEDLHGPPLHRDLHPERAARFADGGNRTCLDQARRQRRQNGVAILLLAHMQSGMKMRCHLEQIGDPCRLIDATGTGAADIEFLKRDDVGARRRDDLCDALRVHPPVGADTAMNIVGENGEDAGSPGQHGVRAVERRQ